MTSPYLARPLLNMDERVVALVQQGKVELALKLLAQARLRKLQEAQRGQTRQGDEGSKA